MGIVRKANKSLSEHTDAHSLKKNGKIKTRVDNNILEHNTAEMILVTRTAKGGGLLGAPPAMIFDIVQIL
jgi:hypothetical protein